ncbi:MAG: acylneuraminate cytidylyltransferase family protein [Nanoarchaeota archaeon]
MKWCIAMTEIHVLVVIPARGGSKSIPLKNIRPLAGKPLITYAIASALKAKSADAVFVSTDDDAIAKVAREAGAQIPFMRPAELAKDDTPMYPVLQHAVAWVESRQKTKVEVVVLVDPTAPFVLPQDIDGCVEKLRKGGFDCVMTITEADRSPYFNMVEYQGESLQLVKKPKEPIYRRQDAPKVYNITSSAYATRRDVLMDQNTIFGSKTGGIVVPESRAGHIDTIEQFEFFDYMMKRGGMHGGE